jgi:hypothetical protein
MPKGDNKRKPIQWFFDGDCIRCKSHRHDHQNYPMLTRNGRRHKMARHVMLRRHGQQPDDIETRHTCHNRWCINPEHLIPGTHSDNMSDSVLANKTALGERNARAKLTLGIVLQVLASAGTHQQIASQFGISRYHVTNIKNGRRWRHTRETMRTLEG